MMKSGISGIFFSLLGIYTKSLIIPFVPFISPKLLYKFYFNIISHPTQRYNSFYKFPA